MDTTQKLTAEMLKETVDSQYLLAALFQGFQDWRSIINFSNNVSVTFGFHSTNISLRMFIVAGNNVDDTLDEDIIVAVWNYAKQLEAIVKNHKTTQLSN